MARPSPDDYVEREERAEQRFARDRVSLLSLAVVAVVVAVASLVVSLVT